MEERSEGERLVKLALCVRAHPGLSFEAIRAELPFEYGPSAGGDDATRRRFERDKESLREYGVFIVSDSENRYSIDEQASYAAPVDLTDSEASLLRLLCDALLRDPGYPFKNELRMVLAKIGDDLDVPDLLPSMVGDGQADERPVTGLAKVRKAIMKRKRMGFQYRDARGASSTREVEPFGCFLLNRNCYVVAFDPEAGGERVFRLDRMRKIHVNAKSPGTPDFAARPFEAADYYGLPFQYGDGDFEALVRFDAGSAWRAERLRMEQGTLTREEEGGGVIWTVRGRDPRELARWCVENGPGVVPLEPEAAREAYFEGVGRVLEAAESPAGGGR